LVYADDVIILGGSILTTGKNIADFVLTSKKVGLEINSDKTKYMAMCCDLNEVKITIERLIIAPWKGWKS
jgi:hypothetical protein